MPINTRSVGQRIAEVRQLREMSIGELAAKAGLAKSYVAKLERGEVDNPGVRTLANIAGALHLTLGALLRTGTRQDQTEDEQADSDLRLAEQLQDVQMALPAGLRQLVKKMAAEGKPLEPRVINALAFVEFRGKRPRTLEDWEFLLNALERSTGGR